MVVIASKFLKYDKRHPRIIASSAPYTKFIVYVHRVVSEGGDKNLGDTYIQLLQACDQLMKNAEESTNGEDVCAGAVEVIIRDVANGEEDVFEEEMKEEPVDEVGVLGSACEVGNIDEESGDPET